LRKPRIVILLAGLGAAVPGTVLAVDPGVSHACASIAGAKERLACYDEAFGVTSPPAEDASRAGAVPPAVTAPAASAVATDSAGAGTSAASISRAVQEFGFSEAELRNKDPERARDRAPESIEAKVTGIQYLRTRERVVSLDNGQVWRELERVSWARLAEGDAVAINRAALGSFLMVGPSGRGVRVRRVE